MLWATPTLLRHFDRIVRRRLRRRHAHRFSARTRRGAAFVLVYPSAEDNAVGVQDRGRRGDERIAGDGGEIFRDELVERRGQGAVVIGCVRAQREGGGGETQLGEGTIVRQRGAVV